MNLYYRVAEHIFTISTANPIMLAARMENLKPFESIKSDKIIFSLFLDASIEEQGKEVHNYDTDVLSYRFKKNDNGYCILFNNRYYQKNCMMVSNADFTEIKTNMSSDDIDNMFLNNILMFAFSFSTIKTGTLMIHSSVAVFDNKAYAFLGKSGTGKSTHLGLWLKYIQGATLLNDDNPIIRIQDSNIYIYGSPWSGKGAVYLQEKYVLSGVTRLKQAPYNKIESISGAKAFAAMLPSCSKIQWEHDSFNSLCLSINKIIKSVPIYCLECLPNEAAARLSYQTLVK
ncbi:MAG: hypothetical protein EOL95_04640 [Bacteroidia bacterium]|nr:hypothetical protein [Bacteroidia bacterium]